MYDFLKFFDEIVKNFPMHLSISYCKICDYEICIWKKNCASDYPDAKHDGNDVIIAKVQDSDIELAFALAHAQLKNWLLEYNNGY